MSELSLDKGYLEGFDRIGIALSGGLDSTVLLRLIDEYPSIKEKCTALHINHRINEFSDEWEQLCKEKAAGLGINFESWALEDLQNISENSLREKRLEIFGKWSNENDLIMTGHHLNDQIETVFFRIFRGTGLTGLRGINKFSSVRNISFYRPFLDKKKEELLSYANEKELVWVEDPSNKEPHFSRNIIRNELLPKIKNHWPTIEKSIGKLIKEASKGEKILLEIAYHDFLKSKFSEEVLKIEELTELSIERQENLIKYWFKHVNKLRISPGQIDQILLSINRPTEGTSEFIIEQGVFNTNRKVILSSEEIRIINKEIEPLPHDFCLNWNFKGTIEIPSGKLSVVESFGKGIDKKFVGSMAEIRARVGGERCKPFGRNRSQKIKNLFQEFEIPDWKRDSIPIIYLGQEIAAVGDLWVCQDFHTNKQENGLSIVWDRV